MKKSPENKGEGKKTPRRLILSRETIRRLEDATLLEIVKGGGPILGDTTTERPTGCP